MIALGGVIGAGLFIGSGSIISTAGPAAILSYVIGGIVMSLVMLMLGEMAHEDPDSGSFSTYASRYLGSWAGYTVGWTYWFKWTITISVEALLLGGILHDFVPTCSVPLGGAIMIGLVLVLNLFSVRSFGEVEYWFSFLKISAIFCFFGLALSIVFGLNSKIPSPRLYHIVGEDGFMPNGIWPVLTGVIVVIFSLAGGEIVAIAAGESKNPKRNIVRATRTMLMRVGIFYVGSVILLTLCLSWKDRTALESPYVAIFEQAGFHAAALFMKTVLFIAFLSVMNSGVYVSSRMLYSLSCRGYAPNVFSLTNKRGVPAGAVILTLAVCSLILLGRSVSVNQFFVFLARSSGSLIMLVWMYIVASHFSMKLQGRRRAVHANLMGISLFPWANILAMAVLFVVILSPLAVPESRYNLVVPIGIVLFIFASFLCLRRTTSFGRERNVGDVVADAGNTMV